MGGFFARRGPGFHAAGVLWLSLVACGDRSVETHQTSDRTPWLDESAAPSASAAPPALPASAPLASAVAPPLSKEQLDAALLDQKAPLTSEVFESALLGVADCELTDSVLEPKCTAMVQLMAVVWRRQAPGWRQEEVAARHLRHPSAVVRQEAATVLAHLVFGETASPSAADSAEARAFLVAVRSESEPRVLARMLQRAVDGAHRSPVLRELARLALDHRDDTVRRAAIDVLTRPKVIAEMPGAYERVVAMVTGEPDEFVRSHACIKLGETGESTAVDHLASRLATASLRPFERGSCFDGLVRTWAGSPHPDPPSRAGYEATMKLLRATPREMESVPSTGIVALSYVGPAFRSEAWQAGVKDFFVFGDVRNAVEEVLLDPAVGRTARGMCIFVLESWDEHARLAELAAKLGAMSDADSKLLAVKALQEATLKH